MEVPEHILEFPKETIDLEMESEDDTRPHYCKEKSEELSENSDNETQFTVEDTVRPVAKTIPKEKIIHYFRNIYNSLEKKLCNVIDEGGLTLDESRLSLVLDVKMRLGLCRGKCDMGDIITPLEGISIDTNGTICFGNEQTVFKSFTED